MRLLLNICLISLCCQEWSQQAGLERPVDISIANLRILTDRSNYIAGEDINFRVFNLGPESLQELNWSNVFYLELISPWGFSHAHAKIPIDSKGASGTLQVPGDLPSGTYYLKGYTRWMRNYGPITYTYLSVEIVNPYIRTVLPVDTASNFNVPLIKHKIGRKSTDLIQVHLKGGYATRSTVRLNLNADQNDLPIDCSITVIRKGVLEKQWESGPASGAITRNGIEQIPETRGVSLSGKVEYAGSGLQAPYAVVYISLMGYEREFYCNYADSAGRFYFAFPDKYGERDLFISASYPDPTGLELFIDQDFCTESISLPSYPLDIDQASIEMMSAMSENAQIMDQYYSGQTRSNDTGSFPREFFYGHPSSIIRFDDFIRLPTMEEYFSEVTPQVSLRRVNRKMKFRVFGDHPDLEIYAPLVMIDGVAFIDVESVLAISPRNVDRIEIVDAPYIRGNVTFGGIINIISRNDDLGLIDLPDSGLLLNYQMYDQNLQNDQIYEPADKRLPDVRNTLYWNPHLELTTDEKRMISFQTSDLKGEYQVFIRGYDSLGEYFEKAIPFRVD